MKTLLIFITLCVSQWAFAQIEANLIEVIKTPRDSVVSVDNFDYLYYINNKKLLKKNPYTSFNYSNLSLGKIEHINTFNPLKTYVFYKAMNALVVLDNRFSELATVNFNRLKNLKLVSHLSPANKNFVWLYNTTTLRLELFNIITNETSLQTNPIAENILDIDSDYNYVWLLTDANVLCYNYRGSLIYSFKNDGFTKLKILNENIILKKKNELFFYNKKTKETLSIPVKHQLINSFFVSQQNVYIYELNTLYKYQINF